jgi:hypothetical protein
MATVDLNALFVAQSEEVNNSKKDMVYETDDGTEYIVEITENIGEAFGFRDVVTADVGVLQRYPARWKMRRIHFADATGNVTGSYSVGTPTALVYAEGGSVIVPRKGSASGLVCAVTGATGEYKRFGKSFDTGQNSGDDT